MGTVTRNWTGFCRYLLFFEGLKLCGLGLYLWHVEKKCQVAKKNRTSVLLKELAGVTPKNFHLEISNFLHSLKELIALVSADASTCGLACSQGFRATDAVHETDKPDTCSRRGHDGRDFYQEIRCHYRHIPICRWAHPGAPRPEHGMFIFR